jgi:hypothetical protein
LTWKGDSFTSEPRDWGINHAHHGIDKPVKNLSGCLVVTHFKLKRLKLLEINNNLVEFTKVWRIFNPSKQTAEVGVSHYLFALKRAQATDIKFAAAAQNNFL